MAVIVAVDIGGTFTDLVAFDEETKAVAYVKSPTSYGRFLDAIFSCFQKAAVRLEDTKFVNHGTTLVINALVQRNGARTALVTTEGFRDTLEIARGNRPDPFDLSYRREEPLISRDLRLELKERMDSAGQTLIAPDPEAIAALGKQLKELNVEAIAISFLNSYANPAHEEAVAALLTSILPGVYVTFGADLSREWYEYERTATVAANAFVGPQVSGYVTDLEVELRARGFDGRLHMMGSNGGVLSVDRTCRQPIALIESGPIGGCIGASAYATALGLENVIAFDMGGTTAKCALVESGRFSIQSSYFAAGYKRGFPIKTPVIDIVEVGSGGGSIAWLDDFSRLHVGPRSAGSTPGPVSYGRGGTEPTITDANLVLGYVGAASFLGGEMPLDQDGASRAIRERIAEPLGYHGDEGLYRMANGVLSVATSIMAGAVRRISVEHGRDPRDFTLIAYGGGGPLHASRLARELAVPTIIIPPEPGNFSATGMLLADARIDSSETFIAALGEDSVKRAGEIFEVLQMRAATAMEEEFGVDGIRFEHQAEMRYRGQQHTIRVPLDPGVDAAAVRHAFETAYCRRYGHTDTRAAPEIQGLHLSAFARLRRPQIERLPRATEVAGSPASRRMYIPETDCLVEAAVHNRYSLPVGYIAVGPALIEEYGSTTVIWPGDSFQIGNLGEIRIQIGHAQ